MARLFLIFASYFAFGWAPSSWRKLKSSQIPNYRSEIAKNIVQDQLSQKTPLVISEEIDALTEELECVGNGEKFLLMGGDCAETFREHSTDNIILNYQLFILSTIMLMKNTGLNVVKIARMAGQFSKPRSAPTEKQGDIELPSYLGDNINGIEFNKKARRPDPKRLFKAYSQAASTLNLIRAFCHGGFADLKKVHLWNLGYIKKSPQAKKNGRSCFTSRKRKAKSAV